MIPRSLRRALWKHGGTWVRGAEGAVSSEVVSVLFPYEIMMPSGMRAASGHIRTALRPSLKRAVRRLARRGIIERSARGYTLTEAGRWLALSRKLRVPFPALCLIASACCVQDRRGGCRIMRFYARSSFEEVFKEYYSANYIDTIFAIVRTRGYATRYYNRSIQIPSVVQRCLMSKYRPLLEGLDEWVDSLKESQFEIFSRVQKQTKFLGRHNTTN